MPPPTQPPRTPVTKNAHKIPDRTCRRTPGIPAAPSSRSGLEVSSLSIAGPRHNGTLARNARIAILRVNPVEPGQRSVSDRAGQSIRQTSTQRGTVAGPTLWTAAALRARPAPPASVRPKPHTTSCRSAARPQPDARTKCPNGYSPNQPYGPRQRTVPDQPDWHSGQMLQQNPIQRRAGRQPGRNRTLGQNARMDILRRSTLWTAAPLECPTRPGRRLLQDPRRRGTGGASDSVGPATAGKGSAKTPYNVVVPVGSPAATGRSPDKMPGRTFSEFNPTTDRGTVYVPDQLGRRFRAKVLDMQRGKAVAKAPPPSTTPASPVPRSPLILPRSPEPTSPSAFRTAATSYTHTRSTIALTHPIARPRSTRYRQRNGTRPTEAC